MFLVAFMLLGYNSFSQSKVKPRKLNKEEKSALKGFEDRKDKAADKTKESNEAPKKTFREKLGMKARNSDRANINGSMKKQDKVTRKRMRKNLRDARKNKWKR